MENLLIFNESSEATTEKYRLQLYMCVRVGGALAALHPCDKRPYM